MNGGRRARAGVSGAVLLAAAAAGTSAPAATPRSSGAAVVAATAADVLAEGRAARGSVVLVNVWATWCVPCREEFPDLLRLGREFGAHGLRLVLVSADLASQRAEVERFLAGQGVGFRTFAKAQADQEFIDGLEKRWSGALPATLLFDRRGREAAFWEGTVTNTELRSRIAALLDER